MSNIPLPTEKISANEAIEGGKRFWDQLVKTVSAAAVGSVPDDPSRPRSISEECEEVDHPDQGQERERERDFRAVLDTAGSSFDM